MGGARREPGGLQFPLSGVQLFSIQTKEFFDGSHQK
jgi:hypothetical protein